MATEAQHLDGPKKLGDERHLDQRPADRARWISQRPQLPDARRQRCIRQRKPQAIVSLKKADNGALPDRDRRHG